MLSCLHETPSTRILPPLPARLSASRAAAAAGYSASTAEKNAATILSSQGVARYLERHRQAAQLVSLEHLQQVRDAMLQVLKDPDSKDKTMASHALIRLYNIQDKLAAQQAGQEPLQNTAKISSQSTDNQSTDPIENYPKPIPYKPANPPTTSAWPPKSPNRHPQNPRPHHLPRPHPPQTQKDQI